MARPLHGGRALSPLWGDFSKPRPLGADIYTIQSIYARQQQQGQQRTPIRPILAGWAPLPPRLSRSYLKNVFRPISVLDPHFKSLTYSIYACG
jgi:hypothetical protein